MEKLKERITENGIEEHRESLEDIFLNLTGKEMTL
jgi:hypothetical protein